MKLHPTQSVIQYAITGYGPGYVLVNGKRHETSLLVLPERLDAAWTPGRFEDLEAAHFDALVTYAPEIVLLGTGSRLRFPRPALYAGLISARIGMEVMDVGAVCRTYNFLATEGRRVAAALIIEA